MIRVRIRAGALCDAKNHELDWGGEDWGEYDVEDMDQAAERARVFALNEVFGSNNLITEIDFLDNYREELGLSRGLNPQEFADAVSKYDDYINRQLVWSVERIK